MVHLQHKMLHMEYYQKWKIQYQLGFHKLYPQMLMLHSFEMPEAQYLLLREGLQHFLDQNH